MVDNKSNYTFSSVTRWRSILVIVGIIAALEISLFLIGAFWIWYVLPLVLLAISYRYFVAYRVRVDRGADVLTVTSNRFSATSCGGVARLSEYSEVCLSASLYGGEYQVGLSTADRYFEVASFYFAEDARRLSEELAVYLQLPLKVSDAVAGGKIADRHI